MLTLPWWNQAGSQQPHWQWKPVCMWNLCRNNLSKEVRAAKEQLTTSALSKYGCINNIGLTIRFNIGDSLDHFLNLEFRSCGNKRIFICSEEINFIRCDSDRISKGKIKCRCKLQFIWPFASTWGEKCECVTFCQSSWHSACLALH